MTTSELPPDTELSEQSNEVHEHFDRITTAVSACAISYVLHVNQNAHSFDGLPEPIYAAMQSSAHVGVGYAGGVAGLYGIEALRRRWSSLGDGYRKTAMFVGATIANFTAEVAQQYVYDGNYEEWFYLHPKESAKDYVAALLGAAIATKLCLRSTKDQDSSTGSV